jgi:hypothetical protein
LRPRRYGAGKRDALPLPAGKSVNAAMPEISKLHHFQHLGDALLHLILWGAAHAKPVTYIPRNIHVREKRIGLEDHANIAPLNRQAGNFLTIKKNRAAIIGQFKAGY